MKKIFFVISFFIFNINAQEKSRTLIIENNLDFPLKFVQVDHQPPTISTNISPIYILDSKETRSFTFAPGKIRADFYLEDKYSIEISWDSKNAPKDCWMNPSIILSPEQLIQAKKVIIGPDFKKDGLSCELDISIE